MRPQRWTVGPWIYPKSADVLAAVRLRLVATYICRHRHHISKTIKGWALLDECRGAERRSGSSNCLMWWHQEMDLEEDDGDTGGGGGVYTPTSSMKRRKMRRERSREQGQGVSYLDPHERFMDRPDSAREDFHREVNLDR